MARNINAFASYEAQLRELERQRAAIQGKINVLLGRISGMRAADLPGDILQKVNKKINSESWMTDIMKRRFEAQARQGPGSQKWRALSPTYLARKTAQGYPAQIGVRTGDMRSAAIAAVAGSFDYANLPPDWSTLSIGVEYADFFNDVRPFLMPPSKREIQPVIERARMLIRIELQRLTKGQKT